MRNLEMKKIRAVAIPAILALIVGVAGAWYVMRGDFMPVRKVCQRWGEQPLDIEVFRSVGNDEGVRAGMACTLLKTQDDYIGMHRLEILDLFGEASGYYYTEMPPTYLIETARTREQDSWQIVFLINKSREVREIVVHKNCC